MDARVAQTESSTKHTVRQFSNCASGVIRWRCTVNPTAQRHTRGLIEREGAECPQFVHGVGGIDPPDSAGL